MSGLDVTEDEPFSQPENADQSLHPPTKMDGILNPKFAMKEKIVCSVFSGTNEKMKYTALRESPTVRPPKKRVRRIRKLLLMREQGPQLPPTDASRGQKGSNAISSMATSSNNRRRTSTHDALFCGPGIDSVKILLRILATELGM